MKSIFLVFFLFCSFVVNAQNPEERWTAGLHAGSVLYSDAGGANVGGSYIDQLPRITLSRYMFKNITFQAGLGISTIDAQKYTTFDGLAKYDFGNSYDKLVPYVFIGGSFIDAKRVTPTLNFGVGNTFWFSPNYGINAQLMYKFSENRFESQSSHIYTSIGIVYSFKPRNMVRRLWHMKH